MQYPLRLAILLIAVFVTYASVVGLGALFAATAVPVMIVGVAIELAKYVAVSYTYIEWRTLLLKQRITSIVFIVLLMAFTSVAVFAYLGQSYQASYAQVNSNSATITALEAEQTKIVARIADIDTQIKNLPTNVVKARIQLMREYDAERKPLADRDAAITAELQKLKQSKLDLTLHVGPIVYIASVFNIPVDVAASWSIAMLTLCLDPFALYLTLLSNRLAVNRRKTDIPEPESVTESKPITVWTDAPDTPFNLEPVEANTVVGTVEVPLVPIESLVAQAPKRVRKPVKAKPKTKAKTKTKPEPVPSDTVEVAAAAVQNVETRQRFGVEVNEIDKSQKS